MSKHLCSYSLIIKKLLEAVLLNAGAIDSINLNTGKLGLSLCLFEVAKCVNDELVEDTAFNLLQEVLALRQKGKKVKPMEIGFVLLYLIENRLIEADFDELFKEDTERLLSAIRALSPYSEVYLDFIPFLSLLWKLKKESATRQLAVEILDGSVLSLEHQFNRMQTTRTTSDIQKWESSFEHYLKASSLVDDYTIPLSTLEYYVALYQQGRIPNRFATGFYIEKFVPNNKKLHSFGKMIQEYAVQNTYPDIQTLDQRVNLLYLLKQKESIYKTQIEQLESALFDCDDSMYEKQIARMIPLTQSIIGYEAGIARLLLYWIYAENLYTQQDYKRFQYIFI